MRRKDRPAKNQPAQEAQASPPSLATTTAERLAAIVEAAEKAAVTVIDDAERQARQYLEAAEAEAGQLVADRLGELSDLTDSLVAQAEDISIRSSQLVASLEEAKRRLGGGHPGEAPARASHLTAVAEVEEPVVDPTRLQSDNGEAATPAGARLLATQMAVSGNRRAEIDARLRHGFEIEDTASILDAILGPEDV